MQPKLTPYGLDALRRGFAQAPEVARRELLRATREATLLLESAVKAHRDAGGFPHVSGLTSASITSDAFSTPTGVLGVVGSAAPVVAFVVLGTRPHTPPWQPVLQWVRDFLGLSGDEANQATAGIRRKIAREGTKANPVFARALERHQAAINGMYQAAAERVAAHLAGPATGGAA